MKKLGGIMLIVLGVVLIIYGILHIAEMLMDFLSTGGSYNMTHIAGILFITVLVFLLGWKAITKGRDLFAINKLNNASSGDEQ